ncbi:thioesterase II family protein [Erwinia psidii]|uniref:Thioesterase n=1 Tax=Erwinia psidii TaxID=69224 RepID=A0A3N6SL55_9GAMM|nr:alpha/beta fold hydrolase [Erwinia psidii]MCX8957632.1 thioesterase [Erwinia psidii]MCX8960686.1 thioesterase [Erwinia psidii]MCX8964069.1 thioesterase [Erwinia psidii]RQM39551.1 thioesterase [Erwinia psidii]
MKGNVWFKKSPKGNPSYPHVFCFSHAGGNAEAYLQWQESLLSEVCLIAICLPGTGHRFAEPYPASVEALSADIAQQIDAVYHGDFYLFGHSMGAVLAYEVARKVKKSARGLIVSGSAAPASIPSARVVKMNGMTDEAFAKEMVFFNGLDPQLAASNEFISLFLARLRKDFELIGRYKHHAGNMLSIPVFSILGDQDPHVSSEATGQWRSVTSEAYSCFTVPGDHFYFNQYPQSVVDIIKHVLSTQSYNCGQQTLII